MIKQEVADKRFNNTSAPENRSSLIWHAVLVPRAWKGSGTRGRELQVLSISELRCGIQTGEGYGTND